MPPSAPPNSQTAQASEQRFRALALAGPDATFSVNSDWSVLQSLDGHGFLASTDSPRADWLDTYVLPGDQPAVLQAIQSAVTNLSTCELEHRVRCADGSIGWARSRAVPLHAPDGSISEWLGASRNVTAYHDLQVRHQVLVTELEHRIRNLMGIVQSLASQTIEDSVSMDEFEQEFERRLVAVGRVQSLLSSSDQDITIAALVQLELAALRVPGASDRINAHGPEVRLRPASVQPIALALHELAANACKYGALQTPAGSLEVTWSLNQAAATPHLQLEWIERGVPDPLPGIPSGYGRALIEQALPYALEAVTIFAVTDDGIHCTVHLPLDGEAQGWTA